MLCAEPRHYSQACCHLELSTKLHSHSTATECAVNRKSAVSSVLPGFTPTQGAAMTRRLLDPGHAHVGRNRLRGQLHQTCALSPMRLPVRCFQLLSASLAKRSIHQPIKQTRNLHLSRVERTAKLSGKFSKKLRLEQLQAVRLKMEGDTKMKETLAPLQAAVKEQVSSKVSSLLQQNTKRL